MFGTSQTEFNDARKGTIVLDVTDEEADEIGKKGRKGGGGSDLYFIKTKNVGNNQNRVEVHSRTAASSYQSGIDAVANFGSGDQNNGWFQVGNKS